VDRFFFVHNGFHRRELSDPVFIVAGMDDPVEQIQAQVRALVAQDPHALPDTALLTSTESILHLVNQLRGVIAARLQVIDARDATVTECGRHTRGWLVEEQHLSEEEASRHLTVAKALPVCPSLAPALLAGQINLDHARVIATGVGKVPVEIRDVFEKELVKAAEACEPGELGRFAREIRARLGAEEDTEAAAQRRYDARWLRITQTFDGMHAVDGMLDPAGAAVVKAALAPFLDRAGDADTRTAGQRCADGLVTLAETAMTTGTLPEHGGEKPHVVLTIPYPTLAADLDAANAGTATMNGLEISPRTARMIACDAGIIPAVLGSNSEVLDLGRKQPTWSLPQRRALRIEDRGCRFTGCRASLDRCRIHHIHHWARGGPTTTRNGVHLCRFHHWLIHHHNWQITKNHHGHVTVRRT
jgi:Domain of unknown function (DUF222)